MFGKYELIERTYILFIFIIILAVVNPVQAILKEGIVNQLPPEASEPHDLSQDVLESPSVIPFESQFSPESGWDNLLYENSSTIPRSYDQPLDLEYTSKNENAISEASRAFAQSWLNVSGFGNISLNILSIRQAFNWTMIYIQPEINEIPVYDSFLILSINDQGKIAALKAQGFGSETKGEFSLTNDQAKSIAMRAFTARINDCIVRPVYLPSEEKNNTIHLRSTYEIRIVTPDPVLQPTLYLDGETGKIFAAENRVNFTRQQGRMHGLYHSLKYLDDCELGEVNFDRMNSETDDTHLEEDIGSFVTEMNPKNGINLGNKNNSYGRSDPTDEIWKSLESEIDELNNLKLGEYDINGEGLPDKETYHNRIFDRSSKNSQTSLDDIKVDGQRDNSTISYKEHNLSDTKGKSDCDSLYSFIQLHHARDIRTYFEDVLNTGSVNGNVSDNLPNYRILSDRFQKHGIYLGDYPHFNFRRLTLQRDTVNSIIGNNNYELDPGGTPVKESEYFQTGTQIPLRELMLGPYTRRILRALRSLSEE